MFSNVGIFMNELFAATNRSFNTKIGDREITVRQIQVKEIDIISIYAQPIKKALFNDVDNIDAVLEKELMNAIQLSSILSTLSVEELTQYFLSDYDSVKSIIHSCIIINESYFIDEVKTSMKKKSDNSTWFDTFQFLISNGHRHDDIMNMSYSAFTAYIKASGKTHSMNIASLSNAVRAAHHADDKRFSKFIDTLME